MFAPFRRKVTPHHPADGSTADGSTADGSTADGSAPEPARLAAGARRSLASASQPELAARDGAAPDVAKSSPVGNSPVGTLPSLSGVRTLPRPAVKWLGPAGRIALREVDFASDADTICSWQEETYRLNFADFHYTDSFADAFRHDLRRAALDPHHGLFVLDEGELVGFLWLVICENTWTRERYGYINNLYIAQQRRKNGLARDMVEHADTWFRNHRIKRARLTVTIANSDACNLYERCGYDVARWEMEKNL